jgi:hypothetical protein
MTNLTLRHRNRLANLGNPYFDGAITSRGYQPTEERRRFLLQIDKLVRAGMIGEALRRHTDAKDFRVTGRENSWALCDHVMQGDKLRFMLGERPSRKKVIAAELVAA